MDDKELQAMKDELGSISTRLDNVEGYFQNFDTTLNNHMNDYARVQGEIQEKQTTLNTEQYKIKDAMNVIGLNVAKLQGSEGLAVNLIKVITLCIILLGALVGIKMVFPGTTP